MQNRREQVRDGAERERKPLVVLPYVRGVTGKLTRILSSHAKVTTKPGKNLRNLLVKPKDRREKTSNSGLVYQYECECKKVYVGETGRSLKLEKMNTREISGTVTRIVLVFLNMF